MAKKRYVNTLDRSFFGNYIYDQDVAQKLPSAQNTF